MNTLNYKISPNYPAAHLVARDGYVRAKRIYFKIHQSTKKDRDLYWKIVPEKAKPLFWNNEIKT